MNAICLAAGEHIWFDPFWISVQNTPKAVENCLFLGNRRGKRGDRWPISASTCPDVLTLDAILRRLNTPKIIFFFFLEPAAQLQLGRPCLGSLRWASLPPLFAHFAARCHFNCAWVAGERVGRAAPAAMMVESLHLVSLNAKVKHWPARPEPWLPVKNA